MKTKRIFVIAFAAVIMLALASGASAQTFTPFQEQENTSAKANQPESVISVATQVSEAISCQGVLADIRESLQQIEGLGATGW